MFCGCIEKSLEGGFDEFLTDLFIRLNMMNFLSSQLDMCINKEGGGKSRYEDRMCYVKIIVNILRTHQKNAELKNFFNVVTRMGTWKRMITIIE